MSPACSPSVFSSCYNGPSSSKDLSTTGKTQSPLLWVCLHYLKCLSISPVLYRVWLLSLVWIVWFNKWPPQWILWGGVLITTMKNILCYYRNLGSLRYGSSTVTEANKKLFWLSVRGRTLNVDFQGPDGAEQGFLAARQGGESAESAMTWALNGVESTLGT